MYGIRCSVYGTFMWSYSYPKIYLARKQVITLRSLWMTGGSAWCSLATASQVSVNTFSTNDSLKPELMCSFISWTTWPSVEEREKQNEVIIQLKHMYIPMSSTHKNTHQSTNYVGLNTIILLTSIRRGVYAKECYVNDHLMLSVNYIVIKKLKTCTMFLNCLWVFRL